MLPLRTAHCHRTWVTFINTGSLSLFFVLAQPRVEILWAFSAIKALILSSRVLKRQKALSLTHGRAAPRDLRAYSCSTPPTACLHAEHTPSSSPRRSQPTVARGSVAVRVPAANPRAWQHLHGGPKGLALCIVVESAPQEVVHEPHPHVQGVHEPQRRTACLRRQGYLQRSAQRAYTRAAWCNTNWITRLCRVTIIII